MSTISMFGCASFMLVDEAVAAVDAGAAGLVVDDDGDLARAADQFGHLVGGQRRGGHVVGGGGGRPGCRCRRRSRRRRPGCRRPWPARSSGIAGLAVERGEADGGRLLRRARSASMSICLSTWVSVSGPSKVIVDAELRRRPCSAPGLHGLPELVLEALGDQRRCTASSWRDAASAGAGEVERRAAAAIERRAECVW
ncbi:MAG: hypothetical protein V9G20_29765 [Candidatus Promineifilaceae bacterium]